MTATILDAKIEELRTHFPSIQERGYFNAGSNGPIPDIAHKAMVAGASEEFEQGRIGPGMYEKLPAYLASARERIAHLINATPGEIAITTSTGDGLNIAFAGLRWQPGDEIVTTNLEHPCMFRPMLLAGHKHGVITRVADIGYGDLNVVRLIEERLTKRTRVIAVSHLQWSTGAVMPLQELADLAHSRGILLFVDGAQSTGQIPIDVKKSGVDVYALPGQKWLCGFTGTGALYVAANCIPDIQPSFIRSCAAADLDGGFVVPAPGALRYEFVDGYGPMIRAWNAVLGWLQDEVEHEWMFERIHELGQRFHRGISGIHGLNVITPREFMGGIVNFTIDGLSAHETASAIYEQGHVVRSLVAPPCPSSVRVSNGWWNTGAEVDSLVDAIAVIARAAREN
jgi:L-cysteine/cystine lyase